MNHLHLAALLQSGLSLDLPDGSQLVTGALRPESPWVGKQIQARVLIGPLADAKLVAVLRGKSVMMARPETGAARGQTFVDRVTASARRTAEAPRTCSGTGSAPKHGNRRLSVRQRLRPRDSRNLTQDTVAAWALLRLRADSSCTPHSPPPRIPHGGAHRGGGLSRVSLRIRRTWVRRGLRARKTLSVDQSSEYRRAAWR